MPVEKTMRGLEDLTPCYEDGGRVATCGDVSGHEFHGNQYTGGSGGSDGIDHSVGAHDAAQKAKTVEDHQAAAQYHSEQADYAFRRGSPSEAKKHVEASRAHAEAAKYAQGKIVKNPTPADAKALSKTAHEASKSTKHNTRAEKEAREFEASHSEN